MERRKIAALFLGIALPALGFAESKVERAFDRIKGLAGTWKASSPEGEINLRYEVISEGHAVAEHLFGMVTVYHLDGDSIMATHYCSAGNQPRLRATADNINDNEISFSLVDVSNLPNAEAGHIAALNLAFPQSYLLEQTWRYDQGGKMGEPFTFAASREFQQGNYQISVDTAPTKSAASIRVQVPTEQLGTLMGPLIGEVAAYLYEIGVMVSGAPFARFHHYSAESIDFDAGFTVATPIAGNERVLPTEIGADLVAVTVHTGTPESSGEAYEALHAWMASERFEAAGAPWESYLEDDPKTPESEAKTIIRYPIVKSSK